MGKENNLTDFVVDIANAIRERKGTSEPINPQDFSSEIRGLNIGGGNRWTGHADVEGLKAIGWTDEDIAYYQENGVNWNEEDDQYHLVPEDNKALYGVLTADNISSYRDRIMYLPKIDTSTRGNMFGLFYMCRSLVAIPYLDTQNARNMESMFSNCSSLVSIPALDTQNVSSTIDMFSNCSSLVSIPALDTQNVTDMSRMFSGCYSLISIPYLDTRKANNMTGMFNNCHSLVSIHGLDTQNTSNGGGVFGANNSLVHLRLKNALKNLSLGYSVFFSKESLLYIINNAVTSTNITISLHSCAYTRLADDADVIAALINHPNISLASA